MLSLAFGVIRERSEDEPGNPQDWLCFPGCRTEHTEPDTDPACDLRVRRPEVSGEVILALRECSAMAPERTTG
jgi:hypothetical protein